MKLLTLVPFIFFLAFTSRAGSLTYTTAQVQSLLDQVDADYTPAQIDTLVSNIDVRVSVTESNLADKAYGIIYIHDGTNTLTTTVGTNYYQIGNFSTNGNVHIENYGVTVSSSNVVLNTVGVHYLDAYVSFIGKLGDVYEGAFFIDGVHHDVGEGKVTATSNTAITDLKMTSIAIVTTNLNTAVDIRVEGTAGSVMTIKQAVLRVHKIH